MSFNCLIDHFPTDYKGYSINTSYRSALKALEILDNPQFKNTDNEMQSVAVYLAAIDCIFVDGADVISDDKLGFQDAINGMMWWLAHGDNDPIEQYWKTWRIPPDIDDVSFSMDAYLNKSSDKVTIDVAKPDGKTVQEEVSKVCTLEYNAPDGTIRYFKKYNGEPPVFDYYEDRELIYSGFYKMFNIDLDIVDLHWFKFNLLLSELLSNEGTAFRRKIEVRTFNPDNYDSKTQKKFIADNMKLKRENRVLGYLPYIKK